MHERSIDDDDRVMIEPVRPERHYDLEVRPPGPEEPACDCAGPPPEFLLPPPPVDPAWAAPDGDVCDMVAPHQACVRLAGSGGAGSGGSSPVPVLAAILTAAGLLLLVLLAGMFFFCRYRRRMRGLMSNKSSGKRSDAARMLYDGLPVQTQVVPNNLRSNGQTPHIEMVAVKGQCPQLMPGGAGALFVYPPPPSLTDDGSERMSNMYEEIPYYGRPAPSVSYCSDSDDDVSRPSDDDLRAERRRHAYIPVNSDDGGDVRYVRTMPAGAARPPAQPRRGQRRPKSADRRRQSPISPVLGPSRANPARRDESLRRKDPYYYSDILARNAGDAVSPGSEAGPYRRPFDQRRPPSRGPVYCQPDVAGGDLLSPSRGPRDGGGRRSPRDLQSPSRGPREGDLRSALDPGHVSPLASRIALDPFVDVYRGDGRASHRPRHKLSSFKAPEAEAPGRQALPGLGYPDAPGSDPASGERNRFHPEPQWTH